MSAHTEDHASRADHPASSFRLLRAATQLVIALAVAFLTACAVAPAPQPPVRVAPSRDGEIAVMSFNIRMIYDYPASRQSWLERREEVVELIRRHTPVIAALQEVETRSREPMPKSEQLEYLRRALPEYAFACIPEPGVLSRQPILYDPDRLRLVDEGMILDAVVDRYRAGFRGRVATWALFEVGPRGDAQQTLLRVVNVHYHHLFTSSQLESSLRIREFLDANATPGEAVIVLGDFNLPGGSQLLDPLLQSGLRHALPPSPTGSYHFWSGVTLWPRIDHVFVNDMIAGRDGYLIYDRSERGYPSDHFPVMAHLTLLNASR